MSKKNQNQNPNPTGGSRRHALRQQQAASDQRVKRIVTTAWIAGITVIALIVGVMVWALTGSRQAVPAAAPSAGAVVSPTVATQAGALRFGKADAPVTVTVYADFMCPYCGQFERANGDYLAEAVRAGTITLDIHPLSFLDAQSGGARYSTRAANALVTLAHADPEVALRFNSLLYANQPAEGSSGLTDQQLADFATRAGASADVAASLSRETYTSWVEQSTQQAFGSGIKQTPTVKIDGTEFTGDLYTAGPLKAAVEKAASGA